MNPINENKNNKSQHNVNFSVTNLKANLCDSNDEPGSITSSKEDNNQFRNGRWQPFEHLRFIKGCLLYGNNWKKVNYAFFIIFISFSFLFCLV
jgi:hypothetical protein